ncbi:MAG: EamA family transporter [Candidatus Aenigmarchaeota archaeon]|nr:EamA family transporter [Candidatus Aenigmarchaeota archaeon]
MHSNFKGMLIIGVCTILTTIAQLFFKSGSQYLSFSLTFLTNPYIILGFLAYGITSLLFVFALKFGDLSLLYPVWSLSFVWITMSSIFFLNESVTVMNWIGIGLVITGISLIGLGAKNG